MTLFNGAETNTFKINIIKTMILPISCYKNTFLDRLLRLCFLVNFFI